jgi:Polyketide cyclase / dehydrase and lipid transport
VIPAWAARNASAVLDNFAPELTPAIMPRMSSPATAASGTVRADVDRTAHEQVLTWERPERFEYRVDRLSNPLGRLIDHALGSWEFSATERGSRFVWTYSFTSTRRLSAALLRPFTATTWARYMGQCVELARSSGR